MVTRHGKEAAVIISPSVYEAMLEAWEDAQDLKLIEESQGDWGAMHKWEDVKRELGLL